DIADARLDLDDAKGEPAPVGATPARPNRERLLWATALTIVALSALAAWLWKPAAPAAEETRVDVVTAPTPDSPSMAISPDGRQIVFVAASNGRSQLWLRSFDRESAEPLAGTENARLPFWSPDSQSIGFGADAQLKRLDLD